MFGLVANLPNPAGALRRVNIYVGDGATLVRSLVRRRNGTSIGHTSVAEQLRWCAEARIRHAIFTHCGSPVVRGDARILNAVIRRLGREQGIDACIASDGDSLDFTGDWTRRLNAAGAKMCLKRLDRRMGIKVGDRNP